MMLRRMRPRSAFTMIELLTVMLILALLAALLLSAISKVLVYTDEVRTLAEVKQLEQACESFKQRYGRYPPSRIILIENGSYDPNVPLEAYSLNYLTSLFPGIPLSADPNIPHLHNWNGSLDQNDNPTFDPAGTQRLLEGNQCLVYFLGGITYFRPTQPTKPIEGPAGFGTDKTNPTRYTPPGRTREGPYMEFNGGRLVVGPGGTGWLTGPGNVNPATWSGLWAGYADHYGTPYAYFLARDAGNTNYPCTMIVQNPTFNDCSVLTGQFVPYFSSLTATNTNPPQVAIRFFRPDKFQIISAGKDRLFGGGGQYTEGDPQLSQFNPSYFTSDLDGNLRFDADNDGDSYLDDSDNLTNFAEGRLVKK